MSYWNIFRTAWMYFFHRLIFLHSLVDIIQWSCKYITWTFTNIIYYSYVIFYSTFTYISYFSTCICLFSETGIFQAAMRVKTKRSKKCKDGRWKRSQGESAWKVKAQWRWKGSKGESIAEVKTHLICENGIHSRCFLGGIVTLV